MEKGPLGLTSLTANQYRVNIGGNMYLVEVQDGNRVRIGHHSYSVDLIRTASGTYSLIVDGIVSEIVPPVLHQNGETGSTELIVNGVPVEVIVDDQRSLLKKQMLQNQSQTAATQSIKAPMPGKVVRLEVKTGDRVQPGTGLLVLEAMKMENEIKSTSSGTVDVIHVDAGKAVEKGELLISIKGMS